MYVSVSDEGDCYRCFPPDPGIETAALGTGEAAGLGACDAAALGASASASSGTGESALSGTGKTASASASLTFTLDSGASRSFFRDRTTLTPLSRPVAVSLADPSGGPVLSHFSTVLPCPAAPSGTLSGLYLPSFSTNLVSGADLQDGGVHQFTPACQRVMHCTEASTGRHVATFTRQLRSSLYTMTTPSPSVPESGRVAASGQVFAAASRSGPESAPCSCRLLSHETLLWHHRLGHPSLLRLRGMASRLLGHERYFLLVVDDHSRYTSVFPLRSKGDVTEGLQAETSPALLWTGKVGDASAFRVWGSRAFVRDLSVDKLSPRATPCGPAPSGVSQVDAVEPVEVTGDSGAEPGGAEPGGTVLGGAERGCAEPGGAEPGGAEPGGALPGGATPGCAAPGGAELRGAPPGGSPGASSLREPLSPQELRKWFARRWRRAAGTGGSSATEGAAVAGPGGARTVRTGAAGPSSLTGAGAAEGVGTETTAGGPAGGPPGAAGVSGAAGGAAGEGPPAGGTGAIPAVSGVAARPRPYFVPLLEQVLGSPPSAGPPPSLACPQPVPSQLQLPPTSPLPAPSPYTGLAERREPASHPASPVRAARTSGRSSRQRPPPVPGTHRMSLRPSTAPLRVPLPSPPESSLPALADPESDSLRAASPTVMRLLATVVTDPSFESTAASALVTELVDFAARCRLDHAASLVAESASVCPPSVGGECALGTDVLEDRQEEFQCLAAASPHLVSVLLNPEGDPDALDIPTPRSYAEAIEGPYCSQWQAAMDAEMAS
ncbi:unnamed protein product [Closterium sp. NIES-54]